MRQASALLGSGAWSGVGCGERVDDEDDHPESGESDGLVEHGRGQQR